MSAHLHKLRRLTPADGWGLMLAYLHLLRAGWYLFVRRGRIDRWVARQPGFDGSHSLTDEDRNTLARQARLVNAAARRPFPWARCLQRSLALCLWLERQGYAPDLKIGARKEGAELKAHAWVECGGEVINDRPYVSREFTILGNAPLDWARTSWEGERR